MDKFKYLKEVFFSFYFLCIATGTMSCYKFIPELIQNGRSIPSLSFQSKSTFFTAIETLHNTKICKKYFYIFYCVPILFNFPGTGPNLIFLIHPMRRLIETLIYSRNSKSSMTGIQFVHGLIYYCMLSICLRSEYINPEIFILSNILQAIAHYRVYALKKTENLHYYTECLIYLFILMSSPTFSKLLNFIYVVSFAYVTVRFKQIKKIKEKKPTRSPRLTSRRYSDE